MYLANKVDLIQFLILCLSIMLCSFKLYIYIIFCLHSLHVYFVTLCFIKVTCSELLIIIRLGYIYYLQNCSYCQIWDVCKEIFNLDMIKSSVLNYNIIKASVHWNCLQCFTTFVGCLFQQVYNNIQLEGNIIMIQPLQRSCTCDMNHDTSSCLLVVIRNFQFSLVNCQ